MALQRHLFSQVARRDAAGRRRAAGDRAHAEGAGRRARLPSGAHHRGHGAGAARCHARGDARRRGQGDAGLRRADARHQPEVRAHRDPLAPGGGHSQRGADHQPARAAQVDPRDAAGAAGSARHLRRGPLLHRSHRRALHRDARERGEGVPPEVGDPQEMTFLWPEALLLVLAAPLLGAAIYLRPRPRRIAGLEMPSANGWQRHLPPALYLAALVVAAIAAARPTALITEQPGDVRLGIVSFAGTAAVIQQPTHDKDELLAAIDRLQLDRHTAIGSGIIVSLAALFPKEGIDVESFGKKRQGPELKPVPPGSNPNAAIILLTDGRRTIGPDPVQAARMAADRGVRVYTVGFGSAQGAPIQVEGYSIYMMYDEETLKAIAGLTNAEYFHATSGAELKKIYDSLTAKFVLQREQTEVTAFFAAAAAALVIAAAGLSLAWFSRIL